MDVLLLPGAGGEAWIWHRTQAELVARGHVAIAVDLPADVDDAGIEEYAAVARSATEGHERPLVVGLSLGSFTAALVCSQISTIAMVFVNGMVPLPGETPGEWWEATGHAEARATHDRSEGRDPDAEFDPAVTFFHDVPAEVFREAGDHNRAQSNGPFSSPWSLPAWPDVPRHVIIGRHDRFFPADFQAQVVEERLGIEPDYLDGGHLLPLSRPAELATLLESYGPH